MSDDDCASGAFAKFEAVGPRFRLGVIVFSALLTIAALLTLIITQSGVAEGGVNVLVGLRPLIEFSFAAGIVGFVPLALCIVYVCSLEARLARRQ